MGNHADPVRLQRVKGAVRNCTWRLTGRTEEGPIGGTVWIHPDWGGVDDDTNDVELTLTPVGPLLGGSAGQPLIWRLREDSTREDVPVGTYTLTARHVSPDGMDRPMLVKPTSDAGKDHSVPAVTATFRKSLKSGILMELDVVLRSGGGPHGERLAPSSWNHPPPGTLRA